MQSLPITTQRLTLRLLHESDAGFINRLYNTPGFLYFVGDKNIRSDIDAAVYLRSTLIPMYKDRFMGLLAVELKDSGEPIGVCGLIDRDTLDDIDLGFGYLPEFEGKGYAREAAELMIEVARNTLGMTSLIAITLEDNHRCLSLLDKLDFVEQSGSRPEPDVVLLKRRL